MPIGLAIMERICNAPSDIGAVWTNIDGDHSL